MRFYNRSPEVLSWNIVYQLIQLHDGMLNCTFNFVDDCSIGEVDRELNEDDRLEVGGVYFLPQPVNCNGSLVSWYTCFFYSNLRPGADEYGMSLGVYRQVGNSYCVNDDRDIVITTTREGNDTMGCLNIPLENPIPILEGDRIGVQVYPRCFRSRTCPLHPNLNRTGASPVFYFRSRGTNDIDVSLVENKTYYTDVIINVRASISEFAFCGCLHGIQVALVQLPRSVKNHVLVVLFIS